MKDINVFELIVISGAQYKLRGIVQCNNNHFTCAVESHSKWTYFDDLSVTLREFSSFSSLRQVYKEGCLFTIYELREMQSQCEQDEIADYTLPTCANECMSIHSKFKSSTNTNSPKMNSTEPNSLPQVTSESIAREILDSSLTIGLETGSDAKISEFHLYQVQKMCTVTRKQETE